QHPYLGRFINERSYVTREVEYPGENHLITVGPPGRGKTTGLLVPNVHLRRSMAFIDIKGEIAAITARYRAQFGPVVVINPYGLLTGPDASAPRGRPWLKSQGFNPLRTLSPAADSFVDDCTKLAQGLVRVDAIDPQKHFAESARILVSALIMWEVM